MASSVSICKLCNKRIISFTYGRLLSTLKTANESSLGTKDDKKFDLNNNLFENHSNKGMRKGQSLGSDDNGNISSDAVTKDIHGKVLTARSENDGNTLHYSKQAVIEDTHRQDIVTQPCILEPGDKGVKKILRENKSSEAAVGGISEDASALNEQWSRIDYFSSYKSKLQQYLSLGKTRLTSLVVLSAVGGYMIAPAVPFLPYSLTGLTVGVWLTSMSANSINQFLEAPYDAQMSRTQNRPLVRRLMSPQNALCFAVSSGVAGVSVLYCMNNLLTASIGFANIVLYTMVYTPLKRASIVNTWVGSLVGALPPLMGWTAATGYLCPAALIMPLVLYCWQFPHFNALSWNLRNDYSRAGYQMMSVSNPALSKRVAFRYTLLLFPVCLAAPLSGLTMWFFAFDSSVLNLYFSYLGYQFYRNADSQSARALFRFSLLYLPLIVGLMLCSKYWDCFTLIKNDKLLSVKYKQFYHSSKSDAD